MANLAATQLIRAVWLNCYGLRGMLAFQSGFVKNAIWRIRLTEKMCAFLRCAERLKKKKGKQSPKRKRDILMNIIKIKDLFFQYVRENEEEKKEVITAIDGVNLEVQKGDFVVILGHNGSGKSSLAKQLNAILEPTRGTVYIKEMDTKKEENISKIRQTAGMVFQNPDNQIVATIVEEDVAFGPENIGVPTDEIWTRVAKSLKAVGMEAFRLQSPNHLSGGQKQRVAIAGVMAMEPECIILDEPTAMLDPKGRKDVLDTVKILNKEKNITILLITHYMEEAIDAHKIFVMDKGKVVMQGKPRKIFSQVEKLKSYGLEVPHATELAYQLRQAGLPLREDILSKEELIEQLCKCRDEGVLVDKIQNSRMKKLEGW